MDKDLIVLHSSKVQRLVIHDESLHVTSNEILRDNEEFGINYPIFFESNKTDGTIDLVPGVIEGRSNNGKWIIHNLKNGNNIEVPSKLLYHRLETVAEVLTGSCSFENQMLQFVLL